MKQREALAAQAVSLVQELDRRAVARASVEEEIEAAVRALRQGRRDVISPLRHAGAEHTCSACCSQVRSGDRFCARCGIPLTLTCPDCDLPLEPGDRFCGGCGRRLGEEVSVSL